MNREGRMTAWMLFAAGAISRSMTPQMAAGQADDLLREFDDRFIPSRSRHQCKKCKGTGERIAPTAGGNATGHFVCDACGGDGIKR